MQQLVMRINLKDEGIIDVVALVNLDSDSRGCDHEADHQCDVPCVNARGDFFPISRLARIILSWNGDEKDQDEH